MPPGHLGNRQQWSLFNISICLLFVTKKEVIEWNNTSQPPRLRLIQHHLRQGNHRLFFSIMSQAKITTIIKLSDEFLITLINQIRAIVIIVLGVDTSCDDMVVQVMHNLEGQIVDVEVRGPHVGWDIAHGALKHGFETRHFLDDLVVA